MALDDRRIAKSSTWSGGTGSNRSSPASCPSGAVIEQGIGVRSPPRARKRVPSIRTRDGLNHERAGARHRGALVDREDRPSAAPVVISQAAPPECASVLTAGHLMLPPTTLAATLATTPATHNRRPGCINQRPNLYASWLRHPALKRNQQAPGPAPRNNQRSSWSSTVRTHQRPRSDLRPSARAESACSEPHGSRSQARKKWSATKEAHRRRIAAGARTVPRPRDRRPHPRCSRHRGSLRVPPPPPAAPPEVAAWLASSRR